MSRAKRHQERFEALMAMAVTGGPPEAAEAVAGMRGLDPEREEALAAEMAAIGAALPTLEEAVAEALATRGRKMGWLALPEATALRYGAWLLLGEPAMDAPLASAIAADLVDRYGDAEARPLVQGCLSRIARVRDGGAPPAASPSSPPPAPQG